MAAKVWRKTSESSTSNAGFEVEDSPRKKSETRALERTSGTLNVLSDQIGRSVQNVSHMKDYNRQELLLHLMCTLDPDLCLKEIDTQLRTCTNALELLEEQKSLVRNLQSILEEQKVKAEVLKENQNEIEKLKYHNEFPESNEVAETVLGFYSAKVEMLQSEHKRSKGFHTLVLESKFLSEQFVDFTFDEAPSSKGRIFLTIDNPADMTQDTIMESDVMKVWACDWTLTAEVAESK